MSPSTLQYSATADTPVPAAGTTAAPVTTAPVVDKPMAGGAIAKPFRSAQAEGVEGGAGKLLAHPPAASTAAAVPNKQARF